MVKMEKALHLARLALLQGEVPVGAVIMQNQVIVGEAFNLVEQHKDPTAHAEMLAIRQACQNLKTRYLENCEIYVTLEPCAMCAQAISLARIPMLYFGAYDPKGGGVEHGARVYDHKTCLHRPQWVGGISARQSEQLLKDFFTSLRD